MVNTYMFSPQLTITLTHRLIFVDVHTYVNLKLNQTHIINLKEGTNLYLSARCLTIYVSIVIAYSYNIYLVCLHLWYSESAADVVSLKCDLVINRLYIYICTKNIRKS